MSFAEKPKNEKYIFRFYKTIPSDKKGYDFYIDSPYKKGNGKYYKLGDTIMSPDESEDFKPDIRPNYYFDAPRKGLSLADAPHKGLSVIGLSDPMYSLYKIRELNDMLQSPISYKKARLHNGDFVVDEQGNIIHHNENNNLSIPFVLKRLPDKALEEILEDAIYTGIGAIDDEDALYNGDDSEDKIAAAINEIIYNIKNTDKYNINANNLPAILSDIIPNFDKKRDIFTQNFNDMLSKQIEKYQEDYRFDLKDKLKPHKGSVTDIQSANNNRLLLDRYDKLLDAIAHFYKLGMWGDIYLASTPKSAIYNIDDYKAGNTRGQSDFPEELKVHKLRLLRNLEDDGADVFRSSINDFMDTYDKWNIPRRMRRQKLGRDRLLNELTISPLNNLYETPVAGTKDYDVLLKDIDDAKNILSETIGIDPNEVVSDELCKDIWYDLSSYFKKKDRQHNIVNGLSGGDNKWR